MGTTAAESPSRLATLVDPPLPRRLVGDRSNLLLVVGACSCPGRRLSSLVVVAGGRATPAIAHSMPRPDAAADGLDWRSGFWALVPLAAVEAAETIVVELVATLDDRSTARATVGTIELTPREPIPAPGAPASRPGIAICMATYDPPRGLFERQVESIRSQTREDWVCVISDDGSTPEKLSEIAEVIGDDRRFVLSRSSVRRGFFHNFERALELIPAQTELIALADQDDRWHPEKLELLAARLGTATLAYSDARIVDEDGAVLSDTYWSLRRNNSTDLISMLLANTVSGSAALFRRTVVERALPFPPAPGRLFHDHWLALVALAIGRAVYVDRPLYDYVQHDQALLGHENAQAWAGEGRGIVERLRHFRDDSEYFYEHWRTTYFQEYCGVILMARLLLDRCGPELSDGRRRSLRRLAAGERSVATVAWLAARGLRPLLGRNETLGAEGRLLRAIAWRRMLAAQPEDRARVRSWLPANSSFPADPLGPLEATAQAEPAAAAGGRGC